MDEHLFDLTQKGSWAMYLQVETFKITEAKLNGFELKEDSENSKN